jgi:hypothetical protein
MYTEKTIGVEEEKEEKKNLSETSVKTVDTLLDTGHIVTWDDFSRTARKYF